MSGIVSSVGLISGINTSSIVNQLISLQRRPAARMEATVQTVKSRQAGLKTIQASLTALLGTTRQLSNESTFTAFSVTNTDADQLRATSGRNAAPGEYQLRTVQTARTHEVSSRAIANSDTQTFGAGSLVFATGGGLDAETTLAALNDGDGVRRGSIRITDRSGAAATIDLSTAYSLEDVVGAINGSAAISVRARSDGGRLVLDDLSGGTASNLIVAEVDGGQTAADLGLVGSVTADTLTGTAVFRITDDFSLDQINDGNRLKFASGNDLRITLTDDTVLDVDLNGAKTVGDVVDKINDATGNGGKLVASLANDRLVLEDASGGGGTAAFAVESINGSNAVDVLGLNRTPAAGTLTGRKLSAGINSVLLDNLRGGRGIDTLGEVSLTDRAGRTATIDLSAAETLDDVLNAINTAETNSNERLALTARLNAAGTGIEVVDESGSTAHDLVIADVGGGTTAEDLGIGIDAAVDSVDSGPLRLRSVNEATALSTWAPGRKPVTIGSFRVTDSDGNAAVITVNSTMSTLGDVIESINGASGIDVTARLNDTGDGIAVVDDAGGASALKIEDVTGTSGTKLRLTGEGTLNGEGKSEISGRRATVIDVAADDTLDDVVTKIKASGGDVTASVVNTGSPINPLRLVVRSGAGGRSGRLFVEEGGVDLGFATRVTGRDAVLQVGAETDSAFLLASGTNSFTGVAGNLNVDVLAAGDEAATVKVARNDVQITTALKSLVTNYNAWVTSQKTATSFNTETNTAAVLQGNGFLQRVQLRVDSIFSDRYAPAGESVRTLQDLGIRVGEDGKLTLDEEQLEDALDDDPEAVRDFFRTAGSGFANRLKTALEGFTDPLTGTFKSEDESMQRTVDLLTARVETIDQLLLGRRDRLLRQFQTMENTLSSLQSTQTQLASIQNLSVSRSGSR